MYYYYFLAGNIKAKACLEINKDNIRMWQWILALYSFFFERKVGHDLNKSGLFVKMAVVEGI